MCRVLQTFSTMCLALATSLLVRMTSTCRLSFFEETRGKDHRVQRDRKDNEVDTVKGVLDGEGGRDVEDDERNDGDHCENIPFVRCGSSKRACFQGP